MMRSPTRAQRDRARISASKLDDEMEWLAHQSLKPFTHVSIDSPLSRMPSSSLRLGEDSRLIEQDSHERSAAAFVRARLLPSARGGPRNDETSRSSHGRWIRLALDSYCETYADEETRKDWYGNPVGSALFMDFCIFGRGQNAKRHN